MGRGKERERWKGEKREGYRVGREEGELIGKGKGVREEGTVSDTCLGYGKRQAYRLSLQWGI